MVCDRAKLHFLFDNAHQCPALKNIVKIGEPVSDTERDEAAAVGLRIVSLDELEVGVTIVG